LKISISIGIFESTYMDNLALTLVGSELLITRISMATNMTWLTFMIIKNLRH